MAGCASAFALQPWGFVSLFFIGFPVFLYTLYHAKTAKQAFRSSFLYALGYFLTGLYWISAALFTDIESFWWALPLSFFGLPILLSLFWGAAGLLAHLISPAISLSRFFAIILCFSVIEFIRAYAFTGFPWNLPGTIWIEHPDIAQIASLGGIYFLTGITFLWASAGFIAVALRKQHFKSSLFLLAFTAVSLSGSFFYGASKEVTNVLANKSPQDSLENSALIHLVQPNIPQVEKWKPENIASNFYKHIQFSYPEQHHYASENQRETFIIWPETAFPYFLWNKQEIRSTIRRLLVDIPGPTYLITGFLQKNEEDGSFSNALIVIDEELNIIQQYNKHHLVPFGEYIPFKEYLSITPLVQISGFKKGLPPTATPITDNFGFIPLICYEILFPRHLEKNGNKSSNLPILNITNDAWYGNSAGPYQHLTQARFRAIEQNKPVLRVANTGISAIISAQGTIIDSLGINESGSMTYNHKELLQTTNKREEHYLPLYILYLSTIIALFSITRHRFNLFLLALPLI